MDKDQFSREYGFYSYAEMLSESGQEKDNYGMSWYVHALKSANEKVSPILN